MVGMWATLRPPPDHHGVMVASLPHTLIIIFMHHALIHMGMGRASMQLQLSIRQCGDRMGFGAWAGVPPNPLPPKEKSLSAIVMFWIGVDMEIEKSVPMPPERKRMNLPYDQMEIGDSFLVKDVPMQTICSANYRYGKRRNVRFMARVVEGGIREA
ncbi:MAG: hypothetical protein EBS73_16710 [Betaproteobacteria bacterium]|nr:hypothetical protein [Betaproteobacteria bacterium]